jgi:uncharacterized protein
LTPEWLNVAAGFGVGLLVGLTGVGGGALMTPLLVLLFGVAPATAVGTDLWFAAITKLAGSAIHNRLGGVDWGVARRLWVGSLPAALLTLAWLRDADARRLDAALLEALGWALVLTAAAMLLKPWLQRRAGGALPQLEGRALQVATVAAGAVLGFLVTFTSVGAGAIGAVCLFFLYPRRLTPARLVGTDIVHAVPLTVVAGTGYLAMGHVNAPLLGWLLLGSLPGIVLGSLLSRHTPEHWLRAAVALVVGLVGLKMIV